MQQFLYAHTLLNHCINALIKIIPSLSELLNSIYNFSAYIQCFILHAFTTL